MPGRTMPRSLPLHGTTEHRDVYVPVSGGRTGGEANGGPPPPPPRHPTDPAPLLLLLLPPPLQKVRLGLASVGVPRAARPDPCPAIPLVATMPPVTSAAWQGEHVYYDTRRQGWADRTSRHSS